MILYLIPLYVLEVEYEIWERMTNEEQTAHMRFLTLLLGVTLTDRLLWKKWKGQENIKIDK